MLEFPLDLLVQNTPNPFWHTPLSGCLAVDSLPCPEPGVPRHPQVGSFRAARLEH